MEFNNRLRLLRAAHCCVSFATMKTRAVVISLILLASALSPAFQRSTYQAEQIEMLKLHHGALTKIANDFDFLTSRLVDPLRIGWLGTLTLDGQFSNENISNFKQFTVLLQSVLGPSVLLLEGEADIYILFISNQQSLTVARKMFGDALVVNQNGYAFVVDPAAQVKWKSSAGSSPR